MMWHFVLQSPAAHHHKEVLATKYGSKPQSTTSGKHLKASSKIGHSTSKTTLIHSEVSDKTNKNINILKLMQCQVNNQQIILSIFELVRFINNILMYLIVTTMDKVPKTICQKICTEWQSVLFFSLLAAFIQLHILIDQVPVHLRTLITFW